MWRKSTERHAFDIIDTVDLGSRWYIDSGVCDIVNKREILVDHGQPVLLPIDSEKVKTTYYESDMASRQPSCWKRVVQSWESLVEDEKEKEEVRRRTSRLMLE